MTTICSVSYMMSFSLLIVFFWFFISIFSSTYFSFFFNSLYCIILNTTYTTEADDEIYYAHSDLASHSFFPYYLLTIIDIPENNIKGSQ